MLSMAARFAKKNEKHKERKNGQNKWKSHKRIIVSGCLIYRSGSRLAPAFFVHQFLCASNVFIVSESSKWHQNDLLFMFVSLRIIRPQADKKLLNRCKWTN